MKILLSSVKESSQDFRMEDSYAFKGLGDRVKEGRVEVNAHVDPIGDRWEINGTMEGVFPFICDKCSQEFEGKINGEFALTVLSKTVAGLEPDDSDEIDVVVLPAESQEIDLADKINELIWLELPITLTCVSLGGEKCPRFSDDAEDNKDDGEDIDPRWNVLKQLKQKMTSEEAGEADSGKSED
ncbi:MAG: DUF177 domain-containing protein [bacterium]|nr:DUF177 domain-containing protein [bacterium]